MHRVATCVGRTSCQCVGRRTPNPGPAGRPGTGTRETSRPSPNELGAEGIEANSKRNREKAVAEGRRQTGEKWPVTNATNPWLHLQLTPVLSVTLFGSPLQQRGAGMTRRPPQTHHRWTEPAPTSPLADSSRPELAPFGPHKARFSHNRAHRAPTEPNGLALVNIQIDLNRR